MSGGGPPESPPVMLYQLSGEGDAEEPTSGADGMENPAPLGASRSELVGGPAGGLLTPKLGSPRIDASAMTAQTRNSARILKPRDTYGYPCSAYINCCAALDGFRRRR